VQDEQNKESFIDPKKDRQNDKKRKQDRIKKLKKGKGINEIDKTENSEFDVNPKKPRHFIEHDFNTSGIITNVEDFEENDAHIIQGIDGIHFLRLINLLKSILEYIII